MVEIEELDKLYAENLVRRETDTFGLLYSPSLEPGMSDDPDRHFDHRVIRPRGGMFSHANAAGVRAAMVVLERLEKIVEIGCYGKNHREHSSTDVFCRDKPPRCWYVGVDIRDDGRGAHIRQAGPNCFFVCSDSADWTTVDPCNPIDLLFIDGKHSVDQVLMDWRYAAFVPPGGLVIMHDVNYHPGPRLVFDAIDPAVFDKSSVCPQADDFGLGILRRK